MTSSIPDLSSIPSSEEGGLALERFRLGSSTFSTERTKAHLNVISLDREFRHACETDLKATVTKLRLYLEDERVVNMLLEHIMNKTVDSYNRFRQVALKIYFLNSGSDIDDVSVLGEKEVREFLEVVCNSQNTSV